MVTRRYLDPIPSSGKRLELALGKVGLRWEFQGFPVYILHSPEDFIKMSHPESAKKALSGAGAKVELQTYAGGHGWHGDVYGLIKRAIEALERNRHT